MPDITMCLGYTCRVKEKCYRFKAVPNPYRQSYFTLPPVTENRKECEHYIPMHKEKKNVRLGL